jgi:hypothetical protein
MTELEIAWLEPWQPVSSESALSLERALARELAPGHVLCGRAVRAIGSRLDCDDVVFLCSDPEELAVVHLTHKRQASAQSPFCMQFDSVQSFIEGCMQPDHLEFIDSDD